MTKSNDISADLDRRIDTLTKRSTLTRGLIIEDALVHGRSLAWQEKWIDGVEEGLEAADRGDFASEEEIATVLNKHRARQLPEEIKSKPQGGPGDSSG